tara:strand:- start:184 stop:372 length:189 start_codon:yes stop_codon:yes gene_type:complete
MALMGGFVDYLALRGISLSCLISYVYKMANPLDSRRKSKERLIQPIGQSALGTTKEAVYSLA